MPGWISIEEGFRTRTCPCCGKVAFVTDWEETKDQETGYVEEAGRGLICASRKGCGFRYCENTSGPYGDSWPDPPEESATINRIMGIGGEDE